MCQVGSRGNKRRIQFDGALQSRHRILHRMPLHRLALMMRPQIELVCLVLLRRISTSRPCRRNRRDRQTSRIDPAAHAIHELRRKLPAPAALHQKIVDPQLCAIRDPGSSRPSASACRASRQARRSERGPLRASCQSRAPAIPAWPASTPNPEPPRRIPHPMPPPSPPQYPSPDIPERHTQPRTAESQVAAARPLPASRLSAPPRTFCIRACTRSPMQSAGCSRSRSLAMHFATTSQETCASPQTVRFSSSGPTISPTRLSSKRRTAASSADRR